MEKIIQAIQKKSSVDALVAVVYLALVGFLKWRLIPSIDGLLFFTGGVLGIYLLEIVELWLHLIPSPFRSIVFAVGLMMVSFFVITSTASLLGSGLVLSLLLTIALWQMQEWRSRGNLNQWYTMINGKVASNVQQLLSGGFILLFLVETFLFLR